MARARSRKTPIVPEDLLRFRLLSDPQISPDGSDVVYVEKQVTAKNSYQTRLWMIDSRGQRPARPFTSGDKDRRPRWSPDGSQLAMIREADDQPAQLYLIPRDGGEARCLTDFPEGSLADYAWSPCGKWFAVKFREQDPEWTNEAKQERKDKGLSTPPRVIDDWWYREDGDGYFIRQRFQLYLVDADSGESRKIYGRDTLGDFSFDFSPDGSELVVSTNRDRRALLRPWKDELLRIEVPSGKLTPIPGLPPGPKDGVRWSPDGRWIAYAGRKGKDGAYSVENLELWITDPKGQQSLSLTGGSDDCLLATAIADTSEATFTPQFEFAADSSGLYLQLGWHGAMQLAWVSIEQPGKVVRLTAGDHDLAIGNVSADGKQMPLTWGHPTQLHEVAMIDLSQPSRNRSSSIKVLTERNAEWLGQRKLAAPEVHWITAEDGHQVQVWSMLPVDAKKRQQLPAILEIHGGPHAQYGSGFFHEFQVLAAQGYAVFYSNPRGSKGYGRDHCAAIRGSWGTDDWTDIQAVTRFMQEHAQVDAKRMGVMGGSYGGYMTNWAISHCHDFRAAITDRCVSNLVSMGGSSDWLIEPDQYFPGNFWDRPEPRWQQSPLAHFADVKTPTLVIHSEGDLRCNIEQGEQVFGALKLLGVPCRFVRYPSSTSHGMSRGGPPDLRIHRLQQILRWWSERLE